MMDAHVCTEAAPVCDVHHIELETTAEVDLELPFLSLADEHNTFVTHSVVGNTLEFGGIAPWLPLLRLEFAAPHPRLISEISAAPSELDPRTGLRVHVAIVRCAAAFVRVARRTYEPPRTGWTLFGVPAPGEDAQQGDQRLEPLPPPSELPNLSRCVLFVFKFSFICLSWFLLVSLSLARLQQIKKKKKKKKTFSDCLLMVSKTKQFRSFVLHNRRGGGGSYGYDDYECVKINSENTDLFLQRQVSQCGSDDFCSSATIAVEIVEFLQAQTIVDRSKGQIQLNDNEIVVGEACLFDFNRQNRDRIFFDFDIETKTVGFSDIQSTDYSRLIRINFGDYANVRFFQTVIASSTRNHTEIDLSPPVNPKHTWPVLIGPYTKFSVQIDNGASGGGHLWPMLSSFFLSESGDKLTIAKNFHPGIFYLFF